MSIFFICLYSQHITSDELTISDSLSDRLKRSVIYAVEDLCCAKDKMLPAAVLDI